MGYHNTNLLTPVEAARILGVSKFVIYDLIHEGRLKATDISLSGTKKARYQIREDELMALVYHKNQKRATLDVVPEKKPSVKKPKAILKKDKTKEQIKAEIRSLKEDLFEILIKIEDLENNI